MAADQTAIIASIPPKVSRAYYYCEKQHHNYGHTCRHEAWKNAKGDYVFYIDDDDFLADRNVLKTLDSVTESWAVFPVLRHGRKFFHLPPRKDGTGTGMFIHRREIGKWPDSGAYEADGLFVEALKQQYPYQVVDSRPLVIQPTSNFGKSNRETWLDGELGNFVILWQRFRYFAKSRIFY
jgi:glycosyltransferase involved in cell wall biosynthesis